MGPTLAETDLVSSEELKSLKSPEAVVWIKVGDEPTCPQTHRIKGKFDNTVNVYYTLDNKSYNRVIPHICFSSEEFARDTAGFIKKF